MTQVKLETTLGRLAGEKWLTMRTGSKGDIFRRHVQGVTEGGAKEGPGESELGSGGFDNETVRSSLLFDIKNFSGIQVSMKPCIGRGEYFDLVIFGARQ